MIVTLSLIDWGVIVAYLAFSILIGLYFTGEAGKSTDDFFLSGRKLTWWLAGTSMVATSFATDAPLAATKLVREQGLAGLWFPLSWVLADLLTLYFFAPLWRRAEVTTDAEISEIRYSGKSAAFLRFFNGIYSAIPVNCIIMGWVTLAMAKILTVSLNWPKEIAIPILILVTVAYCITGGLWGVIATDLFQYVFATIGALLLAVMAVRHVGGLSALTEKVASTPGFSAETFNFWPDFSVGKAALTFFLVVMFVQWWAQKNVAGGGQLTQRMFACKNEKHSILSVLWFCFAHYVIRPWPWMLVALVSVVLWPSMEDNEAAYPRMIMELLPSGLRGVLIASLMAAYMSTLSTHLNWGASYLVVDVYKRFINKNADEKHYVWASRISIVILMILTGVASFSMDSIVGAWKYLATLTAGVGPVFILRWYWWRINAWSEIIALTASGIFSTVFMFVYPEDDAYGMRLLLVLGLTTLSWIIATFMTAPVDTEKLTTFFKRVRPSPFGWAHIASGSGIKTAHHLRADMIAYIMATIFMVTSLFSIGKFLIGFHLEGRIFLLGALLSGSYVGWDMMKRKLV